jgi:peroxin-6
MERYARCESCHLQAPDEAERLKILSTILSGTAVAPDVDLRLLATKTAALVAADLVDLIRRAQNVAVQRTITAS